MQWNGESRIKALIMEHIFDDSSLSAVDIALLAWGQYRERFTLDDIKLRFPELARGEGLIDTLSFLIATKGFLEVVDDYEYVFVGERKKDKVLTAIEAKFDMFRVEYRKITGNPVPGLTVALKLLKKHKDWRTIVDSLLPALYRESEYKVHLKAENKFCPPWANFQTWMNQRRFEQEFDIPTPKQATWKDQFAWSTYKEDIFPMDVPKIRLDEGQYFMWKKQIGPFAGIAQRLSLQSRNQKFIAAHEAARDQPQQVEKAGGLYAYLVKLCQQ